MNNFELIDDYLTNKLTEQDKVAFEQQLQSDASLKTEVELQSQIIEGLKSARVADLKAMLNRVPIENAPVEFSALKIAAGLIGTAVIVSAAYFYFNGNSEPELQTPEPIEDSVKQNEEARIQEAKDVVKLEEKLSNEPVEQTSVIEQKKIEKKPIISKPSDKTDTPQPVGKPAIDVIDPSQDLTESTPTRGNNSSLKPGLTVPKMNVEIDSSSKKYPFHYQFTSGKVVLFGSFDKGLYEIIEVNGGSHSLFLFYKANYYKLDETKKDITALEVIKDKVLIQKLKEYRKN